MSVGVNVTSPEKLNGLVTDGVLVGVGVNVEVGVGVTPVIDAPIPTILQKFVTVGVGVGVGVNDDVGVGVGVGSYKQSKIASKLKVSQFVVGLGVGVGQTPLKNISSHKSGQTLVHGDFPDNKHVPPRAFDKHQEFDDIEKYITYPLDEPT